MKRLLATAILLITLAAPALAQAYGTGPTRNSIGLHYSGADSTSAFTCEGPVSAFVFAEDLLNLLSSLVLAFAGWPDLEHEPSNAQPISTPAVRAAVKVERASQSRIGLAFAYTYRIPGSASYRTAVFQVALEAGDHADMPDIKSRG
jgi:hypothetical protein